MSDDYITASEAREILGVSTRKMAELTKEGPGQVLPFIRDPLDGRIRLIKRSDVEALKARSLKSVPDLAA
jgi:excisionase family DNA binding protein